MCSCRILHIPSGLIETRQSREKQSNLVEAKISLQERLNSHSETLHNSEQSLKRKTLMGSGMRGDKIRTIRFQDNIATDHRTGKKITAKEYMHGKMSKLWV